MDKGVLIKVLDELIAKEKQRLKSLRDLEI